MFCVAADDDTDDITDIAPVQITKTPDKWLTSPTNATQNQESQQQHQHQQHHFEMAVNAAVN